MRQIIDRKAYDTDKASLIAHDRYWDGSNWERNGRNTYLYKTENGRFFIHCTTLWQGERDYLEPVDVETAKDMYERLPEHEVSWEEAFEEEVEEA